MAATDEGRALTEVQRRRQAAILADTTATSRELMALLDPRDLDATAARWVRANEALVREMRADSERAAAAYLRSFREAEIGDPDVEFRRVALDREQVRRSLTITGPGTIRTLSARGMPLDRAVQAATVSSSGAASRHALNGGRQGVMETIQSDRRARGWQRFTSAKPCSFCAMIASRGPIFSESSADFRAHDHCQCSAEPVYRADSRMPEPGRQARDLWQRSTHGLSGRDAMNAFRRAYEAA